MKYPRTKKRLCELAGIITEVPGKDISPQKTWWKNDPKNLMTYLYWQKSQLPPSNRSKYNAALADIVKKLNAKFPAPAGVAKKFIKQGMTESKQNGLTEAAKHPDYLGKVLKKLVSKKVMGPGDAKHISQDVWAHDPTNEKEMDKFLNDPDEMFPGDEPFPTKEIWDAYQKDQKASKSRKYR